MNQFKSAKAFLSYYAKWVLLSSLAGILCGGMSAGFLLLLQATTDLRNENNWLLYLLPIGGLIVGGIYHFFGRSVESGTNLLISEFHDPRTVVPLPMAPLVLAGTLLTQLFGGSAGREGPAVQMGGTIADQLTHLFKLSRDERRTLLMAGMSGGFASVFGVPVAGMIFGMEILAVGRLHAWAIVECAITAFVAHHVTLALGVHHTSYTQPEAIGLTVNSGVLAIFAGLCFGLAARIFVLLSDQISKTFKAQFPLLPVRAFVGGAIMATIYYLLPLTTRYAGLGIPLIEDSLKTPTFIYDWVGKILFTAVTLAAGFKGGEVTPLLFIGASLGNALSTVVQLSLPMLAAMGFVAVFAGAANTPIACTIMAVELFGPHVAIYAALACVASYAVSGHYRIYHAQIIHLQEYSFVDRCHSFVKLLFKRPPLTEVSKPVTKISLKK